MELDQALDPLRRVLLERESLGNPKTVAAAAVKAARAALAGGVDTPSLWELGTLRGSDEPEARRLLTELEQELWQELRLPHTFEARNRALARYCLRDLLDGRIDPRAAARRVGYKLCPADDPDSPLLPVREWLDRAEEEEQHGDGPTTELMAELHDLAAQLLAGPLS